MIQEFFYEILFLMTSLFLITLYFVRKVYKKDTEDTLKHVYEQRQQEIQEKNAQTSKNYKVEIPKIEDEKKTKIQEMFFKMSQKAEKLLSTDHINRYDNMGMFDIMGKSIDIMQNAVLECKMAGYSPDLIIGIPNNACGFYEFNRAYEMIELGRMIAKDQIDTEV